MNSLTKQQLIEKVKELEKLNKEQQKSFQVIYKANKEKKEQNMELRVENRMLKKKNFELSILLDTFLKERNKDRKKR